MEFFSRQLSLKSIQVYTGELYRRKRMLGLPDMLLYVVHTNLLVLTKNHTAKFRIIIVAEIGGPAPLKGGIMQKIHFFKIHIWISLGV